MRDVLRTGYFGKKTDQGNDDQSCQHAEDTGIDGALEQRGEQGFPEHIGGHDQCGEQEADPHGSSGYPLPIQTVQEGGQECTGQGAPGNAHQLGNEGLFLFVNR